MDIKKLENYEIVQVAEIASQSFSGLSDPIKALKWIECNFNAYPRMQYFVAKTENKILGYILWIEKGGFRQESVWELEQIAIEQKFRNNGVGTELVIKSLENIKKYLEQRNSKLKLIEVTTGTDNRAQEIYKKILNAEVEAIIKDLFRGDEVLMIARFEKNKKNSYESCF